MRTSPPLIEALIIFGKLRHGSFCAIDLCGEIYVRHFIWPSCDILVCVIFIVRSQQTNYWGIRHHCVIESVLNAEASMLLHGWETFAQRVLNPDLCWSAPWEHTIPWYHSLLIINFNVVISDHLLMCTS